MKIHKIYLITNNIKNKHYVGYTGETLEDRLIKHLSAAKRGSMYFIHQSIRKYGWENFSIKTIYESLEYLHTRKEMEPYFIKEYNSYGSNGYNMTPGGDGSPDTLEKRTNISKGNKGKIRTKEMNQKNSERGKKMIWITDGAISIRIHKDDLIPNNYRRGRILYSPNRIKQTIRPKFPNGYKPSTKQRKIITNTENISKALLGNTRAAGNHNVVNTIWINNGSINKRIHKDLTIPNDFIKGKI